MVQLMIGDGYVIRSRLDFSDEVDTTDRLTATRGQVIAVNLNEYSI